MLENPDSSSSFQVLEDLQPGKSYVKNRGVRGIIGVIWLVFTGAVGLEGL